MKRAAALILSVLVLFTGCSQAITPSKDSVASTTEKTPEYSRVQKVIDWSVETPAFSGLNDEALLRYLEDEIYSQVVSSFSTTEYIVERVSAVYLSKEYLEETAYNSKENIFFGYSLSDLDQYFGDTKYVFTTGEDGQTVVKKLTSVPEEEYYNKIIKNVAI